MNPDCVGIACVICNKTFSKTKYCTRHMKDVHKINHKGETISEATSENVLCMYCGKLFSYKSNLQRHINSVHLLDNKTSELLPCAHCSYKTVSKYNLIRHVSKVHNNASAEQSPTILHKCLRCPAVYKWLKSLKRHERKSHGIGQSATHLKRKCPLCLFTSNSKTNTALYDHFKNSHNISVKWEQHNFDSFDAFETWKEDIEKSTVATYIKRWSSKTTQIFQCHRSGVHKSIGTGRRHLKVMGSCKINGFCPGVIRVTLKENNIRVRHQTIHVGHANELKHIRLTNKEREMIATQLASKIPRDEVLNCIRSTMTDSDVQRIHLIQKKDILNIEKSFNLNQEAMLHSFDPGSDEDWVQTLKSTKDTALLSYKPQGEVSANMSQLQVADCSCIDNTIKNNLCKNVAKNNMELNKINDKNNFQGEKVIASELSNKNQTACNENERDRMMLEFKDLEGFLKKSCKSSDQISFVRRMIKKTTITIEAMNAAKERVVKILSATEKKPVKANIDHRRRFTISIKNKKNNKKTFTEEKNNKIAIDLIMMRENNEG